MAEPSHEVASGRGHVVAEENSWGSGGRCKPPSGVQGRSPGNFFDFTPQNKPFGHDLSNILFVFKHDFTAKTVK